MPIDQIVALLVAERDRLEAAIRVLEGSPAPHPAPAKPAAASHAAPPKAARKVTRRPKAAPAPKVTASEVVPAAEEPAPVIPVPVESTPAPAPAKRKGLSAAGRKAIAEAAKRRWAAIRAGKLPAPAARGAAAKTAPVAKKAAPVAKKSKRAKKA
jgi:hypothetical protein